MSAHSIDRFPTAPPQNHYPVGTVTIRQHRDDKPRAWVKVAEPDVWEPRAVWVWEQHAGPVPKGFIVHHINDDSTDDRIENLALMIRAGHPQCHRSQLQEARLRAKYRPKAVRCSACGKEYEGYFQKADSLCPECRRNHRNETHRAYRLRKKADGAA